MQRSPPSCAPRRSVSDRSEASVNSRFRSFVRDLWADHIPEVAFDKEAVGDAGAIWKELCTPRSLSPAAQVH